MPSRSRMNILVPNPSTQVTGRWARWIQRWLHREGSSWSFRDIWCVHLPPPVKKKINEYKIKTGSNLAVQRESNFTEKSNTLTLEIIEMYNTSNMQTYIYTCKLPMYYLIIMCNTFSWCNMCGLTVSLFTVEQRFPQRRGGSRPSRAWEPSNTKFHPITVYNTTILLVGCAITQICNRSTDKENILALRTYDLYTPICVQRKVHTTLQDDRIIFKAAQWDSYLTEFF